MIQAIPTTLHLDICEAPWRAGAAWHHFLWSSHSQTMDRNHALHCPPFEHASALLLGSFDEPSCFPSPASPPGKHCSAGSVASAGTTPSEPKSLTVGALRIKIGFWGTLYYNHIKKPPHNRREPIDRVWGWTIKKGPGIRGESLGN